MELSVVIPCYNEAERIGPTLLHTTNYLKLHGFDYEIIIVDDGSLDETRKAVEPFLNKQISLSLIISSL